MNHKLFNNCYKFIGIPILIFSLVFPSFYSFAEPEEENSTEVTTETEEPEFPPSYYEPIQSNEIPDWPEGPMIEAQAAIVMDAGSNSILYEKNIDQELYPASITKVMTVLVALENASLDDTVTFSENAVLNLEEGSSHIGIRPGEKLTMRQCLYAIMLASANEVSNAVAEHISGSVDEFVKLMNEKAAKLGCQHTNFTNPHGLQNEKHYTSAYDMALISQAAIANPTFVEIASTKSYTIPITNMVAEERTFQNHHKMLLTDSSFSYNGCEGGKTGYTSSSLNTLITFSNKNGMELICVLLKVNGSEKTYKETTELLDYSYNNFKRKSPGIGDYKELLMPSLSIPEKYASLLLNSYSPPKYTLDSKSYYIMPNSISPKAIDINSSIGTPNHPMDIVTSYLYQGKLLGTWLFHNQKDSIFYYEPNPQLLINKNKESSTNSLESDFANKDTNTTSTPQQEASLEDTSLGASNVIQRIKNGTKKLHSITNRIINTPILLTIAIAGFIILIFLLFTFIKFLKHRKIMKKRKLRKTSSHEEDNLKE